MSDRRRYAIVSRLVAEEGWDVGWLYREEPADPDDSGWRIFAGDENEDFVDEPGSFSRQPLSTVLDLDPTVAQVLDAPVGTCFERIGDTDRFRQQHDFDLED